MMVSPASDPHRVEEGKREGNVIRVGQCFGQRQFCPACRDRSCIVHTEYPLDWHVMWIAIAHRFRARVAIHAVEGVFALGELRDGLVVIVNALRGWSVRSTKVIVRRS
jgi:hypothetical protein